MAKPNQGNLTRTILIIFVRFALCVVAILNTLLSLTRRRGRKRGRQAVGKASVLKQKNSLADFNLWYEELKSRPKIRRKKK